MMPPRRTHRIPTWTRRKPTTARTVPEVHSWLVLCRALLQMSVLLPPVNQRGSPLIVAITPATVRMISRLEEFRPDRVGLEVGTTALATGKW